MPRPEGLGQLLAAGFSNRGVHLVAIRMFGKPEPLITPSDADGITR